MYLTARFNTLRALIGQKEPLIFEVVLKNSESNSVLASIIVKVPFALGFDRAGLMRESRRRLGYVKSGDTKTIPILLYLKSTTKEGSYPLEVRAQIHAGDQYDKVKEELTYHTSLRVIQ